MNLSYDYFNIGSAPWDESCAQVGSPDYAKRSDLECSTFIEQILRAYPKPENVDARVKIMHFPHDFGYYKEVVVCYKIDDELALEYAIQVENDEKQALVHWDSEAKKRLESKGFCFPEKNS